METNPNFPYDVTINKDTSVTSSGISPNTIFKNSSSRRLSVRFTRRFYFVFVERSSF
jgi:hypothetical protein